MKGFYRRERLYRSGMGESFLFHEICPQKLTLRKDLHPKIFREIILDGWCGTIFNEVNVVPFTEAYDDELKNFGMEKIDTIPVSRQEFSGRLFNKLMEIVESTWKPEKFHVLPHSSGFDSRVLSTILKRLKEKHGEAWLGDYLFVESHGEASGFYDSMDILGWDRSKCVVINKGAHPHEAHAHNFEFENAWCRGNGFVGFPVNVWYNQVEWLQHRDMIPQDDGQIQCYTGYGANETARACHRPDLFKNTNFDAPYVPGNNLGFYFPWHYLHQLSGFTLKGSWVHPFYNIDYLRNLITYCGKHIDQLTLGWSVSSIILPYIEPELSKVHKAVSKEIKKKGYFTISDRLFNQAVSDYKSSWYGKNINPNVTPTKQIVYCEWWGSWYVASFCEYLLKFGYSIKK